MHRKPVDLHYRPTGIGMTGFPRKANENLYSPIMIDTKKRNKIMLRGSRGDGNKCCGTLTGLEKIGSRESRGYVGCSSRNIMWFSDFAKFLKGCNFALSEGRPKARKLSASGGLRPPDPPPGALPLDPAGGSAPRPPYRLALCALAMIRARRHWYA